MIGLTGWKTLLVSFHIHPDELARRRPSTAQEVSLPSTSRLLRGVVRWGQAEFAEKLPFSYQYLLPEILELIFFQDLDLLKKRASYWSKLCGHRLNQGNRFPVSEFKKNFAEFEELLELERRNSRSDHPTEELSSYRLGSQKLWAKRGGQIFGFREDALSKQSSIKDFKLPSHDFRLNQFVFEEKE